MDSRVKVEPAGLLTAEQVFWYGMVIANAWQWQTKPSGKLLQWLNFKLISVVDFGVACYMQLFSDW
jgi:hypothetical protein